MADKKRKIDDTTNTTIDCNSVIHSLYGEGFSPVVVYMASSTEAIPGDFIVTDKVFPQLWEPPLTESKMREMLKDIVERLDKIEKEIIKVNMPRRVKCKKSK